MGGFMGINNYFTKHFSPSLSLGEQLIELIIESIRQDIALLGTFEVFCESILITFAAVCWGNTKWISMKYLLQMNIIGKWFQNTWASKDQKFQNGMIEPNADCNSSIRLLNFTPKYSINTIFVHRVWAL